MALETIFSTVLNMSLTASAVILIVCVARLAMKKAPKIYSYLLWALVLFRLLCPVSLPTSVSVIPERISSGEAVSDWEEGYIEQVQVHYNDDMTYEAAVSAGRTPVSVEPGRTYVVTGNDGFSEPKTVKNTVMPLLAITWLVGIGAVLLPGVISFIRIKGKTKVVIPLGKNVYIGDDVESPFVMGIFRPTVYLPGTLDASEREYIIAHECHHISRGDHIFKAIGFLALAVHWFNPLVWLAFALAVRDMEMSCDEAVIRKLGENVRAEYSASLLKLATGHRLFAGGPLAFGENDPKGRVRNLSKWKKPAIWVVILCVAACAVLAIVLLTDLKTDPAADREDEIQETTENTAGISSEEFFTREDFSSLVIRQSTYADVCKLVPKAQQYELTKLNSISYCDYPTQSSGFIRIFYIGENLQISSIEYYPVSGAFYQEKQKGQVIVADDGTEYVYFAPETKLSYIGELEYAGGIHGEEETGFPMGLGLPVVVGMYRIKNSKSDNLLIRNYSDSEWYSIYRKASLPEVDISLENCTRLEYIPNGTQDIPREHASCGEGIVDLEEIAKFLTEIRAQKDPATAGLYELVMKPNGMFENCYQCGVVLACFAEEPNVAVRLSVMSYNDLAYSISIEDKEYVLPATWLQKLQIENQSLHEKTVYAMEDFSSLVKNVSTYEDVCRLIPEERQPERIFRNNSSYSQYPTADGGFIRISFLEDVVVDIRFYPRDQSEHYPVKDISAFSFIVPGKTTLLEVADAIPHPDYSAVATGSGLSWLTYAIEDGSKVRVHFELDTAIVHSVEIIKNEIPQPSKGYPLVFADISDGKKEVKVFAYVLDGKLMTTDAFTYSGKSLASYMEYTADVTSDILPEGTELLFMNKDWGSFRANSKGLRCECEGMMYGDVHVYSKIDRFPSENGYYLGAPSGTNIYPKSIARQVDGFSMHLNPDDWIDQVMWTFKKSEEGDDLFDYEIKVKVGDREQVIVNEDGFPCGKEDLSVWPIDLEQDGVYELVIYNKSFSMFGNLRIYRFNGTTYEKQFSFIFENMP